MLTLSMPIIVIIHLSRLVITTIIIVVSNTEKTSNPDCTNAQCKNAEKRRIVILVLIIVNNKGKTSNLGSTDAQSKNAEKRQTTLHPSTLASIGALHTAPHHPLGNPVAVSQLDDPVAFHALIRDSWAVLAQHLWRKVTARLTGPSKVLLLAEQGDLRVSAP
jgi:hypothetical protein